MADLNDDMDRKGNRIAPQGIREDNSMGTGGPGSTSRGQGGNFNERANDPVNQDRAMNRDGKVGQGSSGSSTRTKDEPE
jgi:hypothetical protein